MVGCSNRHSTLTSGEVHVWTARFVDDDSLTERRLELLDGDERVRAAQLARRRDRMRFVQFRAFARRALGRYLGVPAAEVRLTVGPHGKPQLECQVRHPDIHFNVSHSGDCCLLAARLGCAVGIDIEQLRDMPDALRIARRFFTRSETELLARLDGASRQNAFFALWTHKEAAVKALGESLAENLQRLELALDPAGHARLNSFAATRPAPDRLWLRRLDAPAGHVAALASLRPCAKIVSRAWDEAACDAVRAGERAAPDWIAPRHATAPFVRPREAFDHPTGA
jgi:4'-phosphopantetheinyl transferase